MSKKRVQSDKSKAKRARSWERNRLAKAERIADQDRRHADNLERGTTARDRYHAVNYLRRDAEAA